MESCRGIRAGCRRTKHGGHIASLKGLPGPSAEVGGQRIEIVEDLLDRSRQVPLVDGHGPSSLIGRHQVMKRWEGREPQSGVRQETATGEGRASGAQELPQASEGAWGKRLHGLHRGHDE